MVERELRTDRDVLEWFLERVAIMHFDGGMSVDDAELEAMWLTLEQFPEEYDRLLRDAQGEWMKPCLRKAA